VATYEKRELIVRFTFLLSFTYFYVLTHLSMCVGNFVTLVDYSQPIEATRRATCRRWYAPPQLLQLQLHKFAAVLIAGDCFVCFYFCLQDCFVQITRKLMSRKLTTLEH